MTIKNLSSMKDIFTVKKKYKNRVTLTTYQ